MGGVNIKVVRGAEIIDLTSFLKPISDHLSVKCVVLAGLCPNCSIHREEEEK